MRFRPLALSSCRSPSGSSSRYRHSGTSRSTGSQSPSAAICSSSDGGGSDPICARRTPADPEDFLHGAACHCCVMASETSCERANRFLDRRFLIDLPGSSLGFFG